MKLPVIAAALLLAARALLLADSGGRLMREQAAYDVLFYRLDLRIDPAAKSIGGSALVRAVALDTMGRLVLDLNANFTVDSVRWRASGDTLLAFDVVGGRIWIDLPAQLQAGDTAEAEVFYRGLPKVSSNPPWDDGFVWTTSAGGAPWAGVACETEGGDAWWPCKDHPSDEPDSVRLRFRVPDSLVCVSNGVLVDTVGHPDGTRTFEWFVSNPINNYNVTFYLGDYVRIPITYVSVTGSPVPAEWWFLPGSVAQANAHVPLFLDELRFLEETFGPFPSRADKYSICEAPYWGMEHQSAVAYGNGFNVNSYGFDYIHLHEVAHEWWGNLVTAKDWSDVWIHEGVACYTEALRAEDLDGAASYRSYLAGIRGFGNGVVAPRDTLTASEGFVGPVYYKGAWVLHTLRYCLGDSAFFRLLRRWAYPDPAMEGVTDGTQTRLATTDDFLAIAESVSGKALGWFWEVYLRRAGIPRLASGIVGDTLHLRWYVENDLDFPLPVDVALGPETVRVEMPGGAGKVAVPSGVAPVIDPLSWLLKTTIPVLSASKTSMAFGPVGVDSAKVDHVVITNTWATTLTISTAYATLPDYTVSPSAAAIQPESSQTFTVTFRPLTGGGKTGRAYFFHDAPGSPMSVYLTGTGVMPAMTFDVSAAWNLVSVPLTRNDPRRSVLFPTATTPAWAYAGDSGYAAEDSLEGGVGYWLKFGSDQSVTIAGFPADVETVEVSEGWNLVGSAAGPVPVGSVLADPPGMTAGGFFGYSGGYAKVDTILPGRGYWVKVDRSGRLVLASAGMAAPDGGGARPLLRIVPGPGMPPGPAGGTKKGNPPE